MSKQMTIGIAVAVLSLGAVSPRHIELVSSSPGVSAVLDVAPQELLLTFSADLDLTESIATIQSSQGTPVKLGDTQATSDPRQMKHSIDESLGAGRYTVTWVATPKDDHSGSGRFSFEIGEGAVSGEGR